jgi:hypothetical protein
LKINIFDLEFSNECYYLQNKSIVEKVTFNNRTFYSKFKKISTPLTHILLKQHQENEISIAVSLVEKNDLVNYIVIEYHQEDWSRFYSLIKHLLKSLSIEEFSCYRNVKKELFQLFIPRSKITLNNAYKEVEILKHHLELKSKKSYKIYPNIHLPKDYNIITLPIEKI